MSNRIKQMWDSIQQAVEPFLHERSIDGAAGKQQAINAREFFEPWVVSHSFFPAVVEATRLLQRGVSPTGIIRRMAGIAMMEDPKQRALAASLMMDQVYAALAMYQPQDEWATTGWVRIIDLYVDGGSTYIIVAREGKLYRIDITVTGDQVTLGDMVNVTEDFAPVAQTRLQVIRQADGVVRWLAEADTSVLNRSGEIDSVKLFDSFVDHIARTGEYPVMDFFHLGSKSRMGGADFAARDGHVLVVGGTFDDTEVGRAAAKGLEEQGDYWGTSISFLPTAEPVMTEVAHDIKVPVYTEGVCRFVSILPESLAASLFTTIGVQEVDRMDKRIKEEMVRLYGQAIADSMEAKVDTTNRTIDEQQLISRQVPAPMTPDKPTVPAAAAVPPAVPPAPVAPVPDAPASDKPRTIELDEEALKAITDAVVKQLTDANAAIVAGLKPAMEDMGKSIQQATAVSEKFAIEFAAAQDRIKKLEATDDEKRKTWQADLPAQDRVVVTRPSVNHAIEQPGVTDIAATAEQTLAAAKTRTTK